MAKLLTPEDDNQKRERLREILPLREGPLCVRFMVTNRCNFRCFYCRQAEPEEDRARIGLDHASMTFEVFERCIERLSGFRQFKVFNFTGGGEPLLHPDIDRMAALVRDKKLARQIEVTTNGALLTREKSDGLLAAGVDRVKVSLQGLSAQDYQKNCRASIDYTEFQDQLRYFYEHRGKAQLFVKIIDAMVPTPEARQAFLRAYGDMVDEYEIECLYPTPAAKEAWRAEYDHTLYGSAISHYEVCPQPFYSVTVFPDGYAYPCCLLPNPAPLCNLAEERLKDVWHGEEHLALLRGLLRGKRREIPVCADCELYSYISAPNDNLDDCADELWTKYQNL